MISHKHFDHTGGMKGVRRDHPGIRLHMPERGGKPQRLSYGVYTTGVLGGGIPEQALVIATSKGHVVLTGCAHPGIVRIVETAQKLYGGDIHLVMGGFHHPPPSAATRLHELGVRCAGPSHCTGDKAISAFEKVFGDGFVRSGAGRHIHIGPE